MNREEFNNHSMITGNSEIKELVNILFDRIEEKGIKYFISVRKNGMAREFTIKSENDSGVIATIELQSRNNNIDIEIHVKCTKASDIDMNVLALIKKSHLR